MGGGGGHRYSFILIFFSFFKLSNFKQLSFRPVKVRQANSTYCFWSLSKIFWKLMSIKTVFTNAWPHVNNCIWLCLCHCTLVTVVSRLIAVTTLSTRWQYYSMNGTSDFCFSFSLFYIIQTLLFKINSDYIPFF